MKQIRATTGNRNPAIQFLACPSPQNGGAHRWGP